MRGADRYARVQIVHAAAGGDLDGRGVYFADVIASVLGGGGGGGVSIWRREHGGHRCER